MPWLRYSARGPGGREMSTATRPSGPHNVPPAGRAGQRRHPGPVPRPAPPRPSLPSPPRLRRREAAAPRLHRRPSRRHRPSAAPARSPERSAQRRARSGRGPAGWTRMDADGAPPPRTHILSAAAAPRPSHGIDASGREGAAPARDDGVTGGRDGQAQSEQERGGGRAQLH